MIITNNSAFHIHTFRCNHAGDYNDEDYIIQAVKLGFNQIVFTDHVPFPDDPFGGRMHYNELNRYLSTIHYYERKYKNIIDVKVGFEVEYLPSFNEYIKSLYDRKDVDILILGQHMYEIEEKEYSFSLNEEYLKKEYLGLGEAIIEGVNTGLFEVVAHPDRIFRRCDKWTDDMQEVSLRIINACIDNHIALEVNKSSQKNKKYFWSEFWELANNYKNIVIGYDAHNPEEIVR